MYYFAKIFQASGLGIIGFGFFINFPKLMNTKALMLGIVMFVVGWTIERFLLRT